MLLLPTELLPMSSSLTLAGVEEDEVNVGGMVKRMVEARGRETGKSTVLARAQGPCVTTLKWILLR